MKSKFGRISAVSILLLGMGMAVSATAQTVVKTGEIRIQDQIYQILDKDMIKIEFKEGSAELPATAMEQLASFVKSTFDEAKIDRYLVAAWADKEYPAKGELSSGQRKLASSRAEHIKSALEASGAKKVDTFEMTKHPNWIQRLFSTETAEIKGKGLSATHNEKLLKQIGKRLRDNGGPGTVVVVARFKNEVLSH